MPLVLAIETDLRQAAILKRVVRDKVHADLVVVDSRDAAVAAINTQMPDVILVSALLSPRDEDELVAHLRSLTGAEHLQTHTIPQLASTAADRDPERSGRGLFGAFRRNKDPQVVAGCDPDLFADQIMEFLRRAEQMKVEGAARLQSRVDQLEFLAHKKPGLAAATAADSRAASASPAAEEASDTEVSSSSSWASPFEWRRSAPQTARPVEQEPTDEPPPAADAGPVVGAVRALEDSHGTEGAPAVVEPLVYLDTPANRAAGPRASAETEEESEVLASADVIRRDETAEPPPLIDVPIVEPMPEPVLEPIARAAEATPELVQVKPRKRPAKLHAVGAVLRLMPLAIWARQESSDAPSHKVVEPQETPRTAAEELRGLMAGLAVPPQVAAVSYARGVRIRRVRVPGGRERRRGETPGPVILSRRLLDEQRQNQ